MAILPLYGFAVAFANEQKLRKKGKAVELKHRSYASAISFGTLILLIRYITSELISNAEETELEIVPCTALRIMTIVAVISVLAGGYLACLYELQSENAKKVSLGITIVKCCGKILAGSFVLLLVICIPVTLAKGELRPSTDPDLLIKNYKPIEPKTQVDEDEQMDLEDKQDDENLIPDKEEENEKSYIFPDSDTKYLSEDEVRHVEKDKLALGRNEIFARHGYIFNDEGIKQYFESTPWYEKTVPTAQFDGDSVFNDFEKKNIELIKKVENELNEVPIDFIGDIGSYVRDIEFRNAPMSSGVICIDSIDRNANTVEMRVGYPDMPNILFATGTITDDRTVTADCQMFKITMIWNGDGTVMVNQYDAIQGTYTDSVLVDYIQGTFHYIGRQGALALSAIKSLYGYF